MEKEINHSNIEVESPDLKKELEELAIVMDEMESRGENIWTKDLMFRFLDLYKQVYGEELVDTYLQ